MFGIFPGSVAGTETGLATGAVDDPHLTQEALGTLQSGNKQLLVRCYVPYTGPVAETTDYLYSGSPINFEQYACEGRKLDLVLCFRHDDADLSGWLRFVHGAVRRYGALLAKLQITEEPNFVHAPADGCFSHVRRALVQGVIAAKDEARRLGYNIQIGFNAVAGLKTQPERSYERQTEVLETTIRTIYAQRNVFHITHYELFMLRDVNSHNPDPFFQFGLLRDDYTPKPAFERYRDLIAELGMSI